MAIRQTTEAFEPPKYIASLIVAVNDGAKSAQTGALAFTLVGLYLLATAFSTTDEDLLLQHTMPVSQIGVQVPAVFSFAIAPVVFLFIHTYTLIRYDHAGCESASLPDRFAGFSAVGSRPGALSTIACEWRIRASAHGASGVAPIQPTLPICGLADAGGISNRDILRGADKFPALSE
jgi:hypothetical protein